MATRAAVVGAALALLLVQGCATPSTRSAHSTQDDIGALVANPLAPAPSQAVFVASASEVPRLSGVGDELYVLFAATAPASAPVPDAVSSGLGAFADSLDAPTAVAILSGGDRRLNDEAGRALIERVSATYHMQINAEDGPFVILLPRHPDDAATADDMASVIGFRGAGYERVASVLEDATVSGHNKGAFTTSLPCYMYNLVEDMKVILDLRPQNSRPEPPAGCES